MAHWSIAALKFFKGNLSWNFGLIAVFVKVALEIIQKELSIASYPDSHDFVLFEIAQVYLRLADCRVYKGHLQNEWAIKPFQKYPKSSKFVCVKSSLQFMHNLYPFLEIPGYLEIPLTDFCETSHKGRQAPKVCAARFKDERCRYRIIVSSHLKSTSYGLGLPNTVSENSTRARLRPPFVVRTRWRVYLIQSLLRFSQTCEFWSSKANWRLHFSLPSIILTDLLGNKTLL